MEDEDVQVDMMRPKPASYTQNGAETGTKHYQQRKISEHIVCSIGAMLGAFGAGFDIHLANTTGVHPSLEQESGNRPSSMLGTDYEFTSPSGYPHNTYHGVTAHHRPSLNLDDLRHVQYGESPQHVAVLRPVNTALRRRSRNMETEIRRLSSSMDNEAYVNSDSDKSTTLQRTIASSNVNTSQYPPELYVPEGLRQADNQILDNTAKRHSVTFEDTSPVRYGHRRTPSSTSNDYLELDDSPMHGHFSRQNSRDYKRQSREYGRPEYGRRPNDYHSPSRQSVHSDFSSPARRPEYHRSSSQNSDYHRPPSQASDSYLSPSRQPSYEKEVYYRSDYSSPLHRPVTDYNSPTHRQYSKESYPSSHSSTPQPPPRRSADRPGSLDVSSKSSYMYRQRYVSPVRGRTSPKHWMTSSSSSVSPTNPNPPETSSGSGQENGPFGGARSRYMPNRYSANAGLYTYGDRETTLLDLDVEGQSRDGTRPLMHQPAMHSIQRQRKLSLHEIQKDYL